MALEQLISDLSINKDSKSEDISVVCVLSEIQERLDGTADSGTERILSTITEVFRLGSVSWLFPEFSSQLKIGYVNLMNSCIRHPHLPVCDTDSGTLPPSSYKHIPARARSVCAVLQALTHQLGVALNSGDPTSTSTAKSLIRTIYPTVCIFSITHLQDQTWTDENSRKCALQLLRSLITSAGSGSVLEMLCGDDGVENKGMFGSILDLLLPKLTKENWKQNEAMKHVFSWLLVQVGRPWLADYLEKVFPPSLLISDDYRTKNKVLGVHCLHHIVLNVPAAELRQFNRAQVLYDALFNHLYTSEAPLIQVVLPCLIDLLSVLEKPLSHTGLPRKPNRFDVVLRLVLTHMEMEHKVALRRIYASNLLLFIEKMGIGVVWHLKRLERVIAGYLEVSDGPEERARLSILEVLKRTIQCAWPRMECRVDVLARNLLRFLVDVSSDSLDPELTDELLNRASRCLLLLNHCSCGKLMDGLKEVDSSCVSERVLKCIQEITKAESVRAEHCSPEQHSM
ncbi:TELO2-interacting protein 2 [Trichomycterus rosablanca]|uniref:TELO2-interacting protein 2 n=1 Tax=Trichomycterus rosablanca TaxID=2290929 RepID=UPI002F35FD00